MSCSSMANVGAQTRLVWLSVYPSYLSQRHKMDLKPASHDRWAYCVGDCIFRNCNLTSFKRQEKKDQAANALSWLVLLETFRRRSMTEYRNCASLPPHPLHGESPPHSLHGESPSDTFHREEMVSYMQYGDVFDCKETVRLPAVHAVAPTKELKRYELMITRMTLYTGRQKIRIVAKHHLQYDCLDSLSISNWMSF